MKLIDMTGKTLGEWTVIKLARGAKDRLGAKWLCRCSCGAIKEVYGKHLRNRTHPKCQDCHGKSSRTGTAAQTDVLYHYTWRANKKGLVWELSRDQFLDITQKPCHYCGAAPHKRNRKSYGEFVYTGIDRKNNEDGYTLENSLPCCEVCNYAKRDMDYDDFLSWIGNIKSFSTEYGMSSC